MDRNTSNERTNNRSKSTTNVICISGKAQSGKDTTANFLHENLTQRGYRSVIIHYADLLKYICRQYFGWDGQKDAEGRTLLQQIGTNEVRAKHPDFWVDFVVQLLDVFHPRWDFVIIPDTRFPNELNNIEDAGYKMYHLRIKRPGYDNGLSVEQQNHPSEVALDRVVPNYTIYNNGTLDNLSQEANIFLNLIFGAEIYKRRLKMNC